jgi:hypothetical protein
LLLQEQLHQQLIAGAAAGAAFGPIYSSSTSSSSLDCMHGAWQCCCSYNNPAEALLYEQSSEVITLQAAGKAAATNTSNCYVQATI